MTDDELTQLMLAGDQNDGPDAPLPAQDSNVDAPPTDTTDYSIPSLPQAPPQPAPSQMPDQASVLRNLGMQNILARLNAPQPNPQGLIDAQNQGNLQGLISRVGSGISGMVGTPSGGKMDPASYAQILQGKSAQNFNQAQQLQDEAQNQPVQQYMQRQAQQQLGLGQQKNAAEDAIKYGNMDRSLQNETSLANYRSGELALRQKQLDQKAGAGTYTPEQVEQAKATVKATYKLRNEGEEAPQDLVDAVRPDTIKATLASIDKDANAKQRMKQIDKELAGRNLSAQQRSQLQQERLVVAQDRLQLAKTKFGVGLGQGLVPGVELSHPVSATVSKSLQQRIPATQEAIRALGELADASSKAGVSGAMGIGAAAGDLKAKYGQVIPKLVLAEYAGGGGGTFTEGHRQNVMSMLDDPTKLKTALLNGSFQQEVRAIQKGIQDSLNTTINTYGKKTSGPGSIKGVTLPSNISPNMTGAGGGAPQASGQVTVRRLSDGKVAPVSSASAQQLIDSGDYEAAQ